MYLYVYFFFLFLCSGNIIHLHRLHRSYTMAPEITGIDPSSLKGLNPNNPNLCTLEATVVTGLEDVSTLVKYLVIFTLHVYFYITHIHKP